jgi:hypothetical protein
LRLLEGRLHHREKRRIQPKPRSSAPRKSMARKTPPTLPSACGCCRRGR